MENCHSISFVQRDIRVRHSSDGSFNASLGHDLPYRQNLSSTTAMNVTDVQSPAQRAANVEELVNALTVNMLFFLTFFSLWISYRCLCRSSVATGGRVDRANRLYEVPKRNYLSFLLASGCTFAVLFVVNVFFLAWHGLLRTILFQGRSLFVIFEKAPHVQLFSLIIVDGLIVLFFTELLHSWILAPPAMDGHERLQRTVWLHGLPTHDSMRWWKPFNLNDIELNRVRRDLSDALTDFLVDHERQNSSLTERTQPEQGFESSRIGLNSSSRSFGALGATSSPEGTDRGESSHVEEVQVGVVVDEWARVQAELVEAKEATDAYLMKQGQTLRDLHARSHLQCVCRVACWPVTWWYSSRVDKFMGKIEVLDEQLTRISTGSKMLAGSAFVTFKDPRHRDVLLREGDVFSWSFQSFPYFSFGRPPFASVTLTCEKAPHCSDIMWENLHVPKWRRDLVFYTLVTLLFVVMLVIVTAVGIAGFVKPISDFVGSSGEDWVPGFVTQSIDTIYKKHSWRILLKQVPTMVLLFINSVLLPMVIQCISNWERSPLYSLVEQRLLSMNFAFLFLNTIVVPCFGVASLNELLGIILKALNKEVNLVQDLRSLLLNSPGVFMMKYLMNAVFLSNLNQILQFPQKIYRGCRSILMDVTLRDRQRTATPWTFYWGYWYAWSLSIFAIGVSMGVPCPGSLALVSVYFFIRYAVDKHNLDTGVYTLSTDTEGSLAVRVVRYLRVTVGWWWFVMGAAAYATKVFGLVVVATPDGMYWTARAGESLMVLGVITLLVAWSLTARELHEIQIRGLGQEDLQKKRLWDPLSGIRNSLQRGGLFSDGSPSDEHATTAGGSRGAPVVTWDCTQLLSRSTPEQTQ
eukprot:TRINITY_DN6515_c0_g2_i1.p1 TRINITY_DN6515_c0_g2~~TRINITY_DN6515_c0_g2_i1.p1  ORF type:complete len:880 (-),score=102.41 TRINITY_DN6515_c0_g2_i1:361-2943(-)